MEKAVERTLVVIKPDGVEKRLVGEVIARVEGLGLLIREIRMKTLTAEECQKMYPITRKNLPEIYRAVEKHMTGSPSIVIIVEGEYAVEKVRVLRGPTDLLRAPKGTIRRDLISDEEREMFRQGENVKNVMHAPDDKKEAEFEISLLFGGENK